MTAYRPPRFSGLGAHVSGRSAWVLASILERAKALDSIQKIPADLREEVLETYDALRAAGIYWNEQHRAFPAPSAATPADPATEAQPHDQISVAEAATLLGCSGRRIRQLLTAERITGRLVSGRWLVDAGSIDDYLLAKDVA